jgi:hypothetical protein
LVPRCVSESLFLSFFDFQPMYAGGSSTRDRDSPPANMSNSGVSSPPHSPCRCAKYLSRILDLEGHLSLLKRQANSTLD